MQTPRETKWYHRWLPWVDTVEEDIHSHEDSTDEALGAIFDAREQAREVRSNWDRINPPVERIAKVLEANHLAEKFDILYRGRI